MRHLVKLLGTDLGDEGVREFVLIALNAKHSLKRILGWEIRRNGATYNVCIPVPVHSDTATTITIGAAQIGGIDQRATGGVDFGNKRVGGAAGRQTTAYWSCERILKGVVGWKIGGAAEACNKGVHVSVDSDAARIIAAGTAQISRIQE